MKKNVSYSDLTKMITEAIIKETYLNNVNNANNNNGFNGNGNGNGGQNNATPQQNGYNTNTIIENLEDIDRLLNEIEEILKRKIGLSESIIDRNVRNAIKNVLSERYQYDDSNYDDEYIMKKKVKQIANIYATINVEMKKIFGANFSLNEGINWGGALKSAMKWAIGSDAVDGISQVRDMIKGDKTKKIKGYKKVYTLLTTTYENLVRPLYQFISNGVYRNAYKCIGLIRNNNKQMIDLLKPQQVVDNNTEGNEQGNGQVDDFYL